MNIPRDCNSSLDYQVFLSALLNRGTTFVAFWKGASMKNGVETD